MTGAIDAAARNAITDAIHHYYHLVDSGRASGVADLFLPGGRLTFGPGSPQPGTIEGEAIAAAMRAREALTSAFTRHSVSNIMLTPAAGGEIVAHHLLILFRSDDETRSTTPSFVADVEDLWADRGNGWKLASRVITPAFAAG